MSFNRKVHIFFKSVTNGFQPNFERLKMCASNTFFEIREINFNFWVDFENVPFCTFRPTGIYRTV